MNDLPSGPEAKPGIFKRIQKYVVMICNKERGWPLTLDIWIFILPKTRGNIEIGICHKSKPSPFPTGRKHFHKAI